MPSGASTGIYEAVELRDETKHYHGKSVHHAVNCVNKTIAAKIKGIDVTKQEDIDKLMIMIDGTEDKSRLGANSILGVSLAVAKCAASTLKKPLYSSLGTKKIMPVPFSNFINGGKHSGSHLKVQEFMIVPRRAKSFSHATQMISETYTCLRDILSTKYGKTATNIGDEGGFVPPVTRNSDALRLLCKAIDVSGYGRNLKIGIDAAASEFYNWKQQKYNIENKKFLGREELIDYYQDLIKAYPIISIEDPFDQDDFESFKLFTKKTKIQVVGDDLLVTNVSRIQNAIERKLCNALLLKVNQIGTVTEAISSAKLALKNDWRVMVSHRSGETNDSFISDLAVSLGLGQIKLGAPCRGERIAKFNRLLRIEEELKSKAVYYPSL